LDDIAGELIYQENQNKLNQSKLNETIISIIYPDTYDFFEQAGFVYNFKIECRSMEGIRGWGIFYNCWNSFKKQGYCIPFLILLFEGN
jgi:hypothetical protein